MKHTSNIWKLNCLIFYCLHSALLRHIYTIQELSNIFTLHKTALMDQRSCRGQPHISFTQTSAKKPTWLWYKFQIIAFYFDLIFHSSLTAGDSLPHNHLSSVLFPQEVSYIHYCTTLCNSQVDGEMGIYCSHFEQVTLWNTLNNLCYYISESWYVYWNLKSMSLQLETWYYPGMCTSLNVPLT